MKQILRYSIVTVLILAASISQAQVTKLANNNNIVYGVPLGNIGLMVDDHGGLWRTDGTVPGTLNYTTKVVKDSSEEAAFLGNKVYFSGADLNGAELWVTDGTDAGTSLVKDINSGAASSAPRGFFTYNNTIYFFANTAANGYELWKSDGTNGGTVMVKDINPGATGSFDKNHAFFIANNGTLFFNADDGSHGLELWKTDGTGGGTVMIKDINSGAGSSNVTEPTVLGNNIIFSANDGTHGIEPWKSDGSTGGTQLIQDLVNGNTDSNPGQFVPFQNQLFFLSYSGLLNFKLYKTDGTTVTLVKDFGVASFAFLTFSVVIDNKLLFSAQTGTNGFELWSSDGTSAQVFKDINPGAGSSNAIILPDIFGAAYNFTDFHTRLYKGNQICFIADDGTHGAELWITDGTSANTRMIKDINPGSGSSMDSQHPLAFIYTTTDFYFGANNGSNGYELWKTDGTSGNTSLVKDIWSGASSSDPDIFLYVNNHIYLTADDGDNSKGDRDTYKVDASVSLLPVSLLNFTAAYNGKTVDLNWSTATETNTKNFVVQRSYDAVHFDNIGTVAAAGNSDRQTDYHYIDGSSLNGGNKIYYRLQMVDNDGKFAYSKVALVTLLPNGSMIVLYPNPVKDQLYVVSSVSIARADVRITDQSGKVVYQKQFENIQANVINKINVAALAKGVYYLQFSSGTNKQSIKFVKQ